MEDTKAPRFLRLPEVLNRTGLSRSTLYTLVARREFPHPIGLSLRAIAWIEEEVEQWMAARRSTDRIKK